MLWWHLLFCAFSILNIVTFVRLQDDEEDSTTVPLPTTTDGTLPLAIPNGALSGLLTNETGRNGSIADSNGTSKQRVIIALAVLCAALAVLLGFLVAIIVCQWIQRNEETFDSRRHGNLSGGGSNKPRSNLVDSSYDYHDHGYRQTAKF